MLRPPQSLLAALVATTMAVTVALGWFGWRLLDQQRTLDEQRGREQLESSADALASGIRGRLADLGDRLSAGLANPTAPAPAIDGAVVILIGQVQADVLPKPDDLVVSPPHSVPFVPVAIDTAPTAPAFVEVEAAEFAAHPPPDVAARYRVLARSRDSQVRAGALLRLGRVLRKSRDFTGALTAYRQLAALAPAWTDALPAELAGLDGQRLTLRAMGDRDGEQRAATELAKGLDGGKWRIARGTAEFYRDEVSTMVRPDSWQLAEALSDLWRERDGHWPTRGQRLVSQDGRGVLVLWRSTGTRTAVLAAFAASVFEWPAPGALSWELTDLEGQLLAGISPAPPRSIARVIGNNADVPWTLHVWRASSPTNTAGSQRVLVAMMAAMLAFLWGATYFIARAIRREAAVARLQSDFVAAVSHEFRSPLTSVRQMAEMLEANRVPSQERRQEYYRVLAAEATRLQRLVETLLNFGRMEAGVRRYQFTLQDCTELVRRIVDDFRGEAQSAGHEVEFHSSGPARTKVDDEALTRAVRNLLDNAVKYSPEPSRLDVGLERRNGDILISVRDRGLGIPAHEQAAIFGKFQRGEQARRRGIKGTGIGLAMVDEIVKAHHGRVEVESEPGRGSTFTIVLPVRLEARGWGEALL